MHKVTRVPGLILTSLHSSDVTPEARIDFGTSSLHGGACLEGEDDRACLCSISPHGNNALFDFCRKQVSFVQQPGSLEEIPMV